MDITEKIDADCTELLGHSNWACADTITSLKDMHGTEHSRHTYEGQEVIFYNEPFDHEADERNAV